MVTRVNLIRHGETEGAETKRYKGHIDVPLSENGIKQITKLSNYLVQNGSKSLNGLNAVYCSDLSRAVKSAEIIAGPYGLKPVIIKALRERNFGVWEGMSFDEIKEKYPDTFNAWTENPLKFSPIEGESTIEVKDRALKAFNEITERHNSGNIAVVAHGGINRVILCELLGIPLENIFRIEQDFAALNVIELWDYPVVKHINYVV
ncbi:MAG: alpha-ribazole phosphatase [Thermodesulfovibrionia bacterium]|nr:alpha-ribazole phosphatase [Thermodesulfovibrionia bacterium]